MSPKYELVYANGGIQKVRVESATRSAVATCNNYKLIINPQLVQNIQSIITVILAVAIGTSKPAIRVQALVLSGKHVDPEAEV